MNTKEMCDRIQDWKKRAAETARNAGQATDEYVHENVWTTIALAAVVGGVVGYVLGRRRD